MKKLRRRLFILAILFAMLASGGAYVYLKSLDDTPVVVKEKTYTILVASVDIPARTKISKDMVMSIEIPYDSKSSQFYNENNDVIGKYTLSRIYAEAQFHVDNLKDGLEEELSLKFSGNMRAVSVNVNGSMGVANMIKPGDRVDLVVYLPEITESAVTARPDIVKMILQNVEVLAIDQDLTAEVEKGFEDVDVDTTSTKTYLATLSVPVQDVEKLILAKSVGLIDLVLRPLEGDFMYATEGLIWQDLLVDDFGRLKDLFPNYQVNSVGEVIVDPSTVYYDKYVYYTVEFGDTLKEISTLFYGTDSNYILLKQVNNISDENIISAGMGIKVPVIEDRGEIIEQN